MSLHLCTRYTLGLLALLAVRCAQPTQSEAPTDAAAASAPAAPPGAEGSGLAGPLAEAASPADTGAATTPVAGTDLPAWLTHPSELRKPGLRIQLQPVDPTTAQRLLRDSLDQSPDPPIPADWSTRIEARDTLIPDLEAFLRIYEGQGIPRRLAWHVRTDAGATACIAPQFQRQGQWASLPTEARPDARAKGLWVQTFVPEASIGATEFVSLVDGSRATFTGYGSTLVRGDGQWMFFVETSAYADAVDSEGLILVPTRGTPGGTLPQHHLYLRQPRYLTVHWLRDGRFLVIKQAARGDGVVQAAVVGSLARIAR